MIRKKLDSILNPFIAILLGIMVINVVWQVFSRFILGDPSSFTEELARYMLIWLGLFGAAYAYSRNLHLSLNLFTHVLSGKRLFYNRAIIHTCVLLFALTVMVIGGSRLVFITYLLNQLSASLQIKLAYVYMAIPLSGLLISVYAILNLTDMLVENKDGKITDTNTKDK